MSIASKASLKSRWENGDIVTQSDTFDLIDTLLGQGEDVIGAFSQARKYAQGDACVYQDKWYLANTVINPGSSFDVSQWTVVGANTFGLPNYNPAQTYATGQRVVHLTRIWEANASVDIGNAPTEGSSLWTEISASNRAALRYYTPGLFFGGDTVVVNAFGEDGDPKRYEIWMAQGDPGQVVDATGDDAIDPGKWVKLTSLIPVKRADGSIYVLNELTPGGLLTINESTGEAYVPPYQNTVTRSELTTLIGAEGLEPGQSYAISDALAGEMIVAQAYSPTLLKSLAYRVDTGLAGYYNATTNTWSDIATDTVIPVLRRQLPQLNPQSDTPFLDPPDNTVPDPTYITPGTPIADKEWQLYELIDYYDPDFNADNYGDVGGFPRIVVQQLPANIHDDNVFDEDCNVTGTVSVTRWADVLPAYMRGALFDGDERPSGWYSVSDNRYKSLDYKIGESITPVYGYVDSLVNQPRDRWVQQLRDNQIVKLSYLSPQPDNTIFSDAIYIAAGTSYNDRFWRVQGVLKNYGPATASFVSASSVYNASNGLYQYGTSESAVLIPTNQFVEFDVMPSLLRYRIGTNEWTNKEGSESLTPTQTATDSVFTQLVFFLNQTVNSATYSNIKYLHMSKTYMGYAPRNYTGAS